MAENEVKKGGISVETEHIFPVIKKWLYSDKDIFLREIVSNASDAVIKLKRLDSLGEISLPEGETFRIDVELDKDAKTLTVTDNGIGMTEEELQKYICSIALSGALDFIQKYEGNQKEGENAGNGIIGHFGLGFYSAFMVSNCVEIDTLSYQGGPAVHWKCTEAGEYEISASDREVRGTSVIMHISDEEPTYLKIYKLKEVLEKYCAFIPVNVYLKDVSSEPDTDLGKDYDANLDPDVTNLSRMEAEDENDIPNNVEVKKKEEEPINDTVPLWNKPQSEITPEEYNKFYHKLFQDADDPLFWIHINADYPLNFKGILYFPKIRSESQSLEGQVKLFYNQVFVSDNIKEVLPEYLLMLRGALDCPELPLNVSRSYLQDNAYVKRIGSFIAKKVGDKFNSLCNTDREKYEKVYSDIRIFIEFACIRDKKFYDRVKDSLILRLTNGKFKTVGEYLTDAGKKDAPAETAETQAEEAKAEETAEKAPETAEETKEEPKGTVYYATDTALQTQYIKMLEDAGCEVAIFDLPLDSQYITNIEEYREGVKFVRVDADLSDALKGDGEVTEVPEKVAELFKKVAGADKVTVKCEALKNKEVPAILTLSEQTRRFEDMMKLYVAPGETVPSYPKDYTLTLNTGSEIFGKLCDMAAGEDTERAESFASFVYRLSMIAQKKLSAEELSAFLNEGYKLLGMF